VHVHPLVGWFKFYKPLLSLHYQLSLHAAIRIPELSLSLLPRAPEHGNSKTSLLSPVPGSLLPFFLRLLLLPNKSLPDRCVFAATCSSWPLPYIQQLYIVWISTSTTVTRVSGHKRATIVAQWSVGSFFSAPVTEMDRLLIISEACLISLF
jgi:hypothetical protein